MFERLRRQWWLIPYTLLHLRSRRAIESWQLARLRSMVSYARNTIPLYRTAYAAVHAPQTITQLRDMELLPIVSKAAFRSADARDYTNRSVGFETEWATTSGTSGEPFSLLVSLNPSTTRADFCVYRPVFWNILRRRTFRIARIFTKTRPREHRRFTMITEFLKDPEKEIRVLIDYKPDLIETFASILEVLVDTVEARRMELHVPYVITSAERLSPQLRERTERVLGCEVFDRYGMEEFDVIGVECRVHDGFHTNCETLYVEVVDSEGRAVPDGTRGRIIVTDLYNRAMPFIRYDTGDSGVCDHAVCPCGLRSPRVWVEGRHTAHLVFNGRAINHLEFDDALEMYMSSIRRYVVVKRSDEDAVVKIVSTDAYTPAIESEILAKMRALLGDTVRVRVEVVDDLPRVRSGKSQIVADESVSAES